MSNQVQIMQKIKISTTDTRNLLNIRCDVHVMQEN